MIFGIRAVMEALDAGRQIEKILIRRDNGSELSQTLMSKVKGTSIPVQFVPPEKLNQYTDKNHQGVIAFISPIEFQRIQDVLPAVFEAGRAPLLVVLDGVTDVRNFGAIARTCECAGVDALIVPMKGGAGINGDAVKTSAGALHHLTVC
ncbi:MAG: 23S rRNA (guanosine(2251)-2'-O)-methyltransferase RlmB, partial [Paludibacteraceae bacterium]|nr:23S rRNA (guanosine(2251)-2'-O)-methyltransferase RlmB [Paludibacteraceae bacterium]